MLREKKIRAHAGSIYYIVDTPASELSKLLGGLALRGDNRNLLMISGDFSSVPSDVESETDVADVWMWCPSSFTIVELRDNKLRLLAYNWDVAQFSQFKVASP